MNWRVAFDVAEGLNNLDGLGQNQGGLLDRERKYSHGARPEREGRVLAV